MPDAGGIILGNVAANEVITKELSWEFKGEYRKPNNALSPINHDTEHSVENFNNLEVVVWVQNTVTKEIFNSFTACEHSNKVAVNYNVVGANGALTAKVNNTPINTGANVTAGAMVEFTAVPNAGYTVKEWKLNGEPVLNTSNRFFASGCGEKNVTVEFREVIRYNVNYNVVGGHGTLTATVGGNPINSGDQIDEKSVINFTAIPDAGFAVKEWKRNNVVISGYLHNTYSLAVNNHETITVEFEEKLGIPVVNNLAAVELFPNPVTHEFTIRNAEHVRKITIVNTLGQIVKEEILSGNPTAVITTQNLLQGFYFVILTNKEGVKVTKKIIKK